MADNKHSNVGTDSHQAPTGRGPSSGPQHAHIAGAQSVAMEPAWRPHTHPYLTTASRPLPLPQLRGQEMGVAGAWQERPGQVLGSVSGNLRPEQSFPFGENGLFPSSPCGAGRARLHAGATWEEGHTRAETRIGDMAVLPTSPYRVCDRGGAEGSRGGHGAGVSGSLLRVGKSRLQVRELTSNGRPPGPREPMRAAPAGAAKTPKSPPRRTSASPAAGASRAAHRPGTAGCPGGLRRGTAGPLLPQGPREERGPPRRPEPHPSMMSWS